MPSAAIGHQAVSLFTHRSLVDANADDAVPMARATGSAFSISSRSADWSGSKASTGGLRDDGRVTFSIGVGPLRMWWEARHYGYVRGKQFCDEQVRGPFKIWRHTHRIEAIGREPEPLRGSH